MDLKTLKNRMTPQVSYGPNAEVDLGELVRRNPEKFMRTAETEIEAGNLRFGKQIRSLGKLFDSLSGVNVQHYVVDPRGHRRAIISDAFPLLVGGLVAQEAMLGMASVPSVVERLVTEMDDPRKDSKFAALLVTAPHQDGLKETESFPEIGVSQERYDIGHRLNGYKMSITYQAVEENAWPDIVDRANQLGVIAMEDLEKSGARRLCDVDGSGSSPAAPYVLSLNGTGRSLYTTVNTYLTRLSSSGNRIVNNALADEANLQAALTRLRTFTNERGERLDTPVSELQLVGPVELEATALKTLNSEMVPGVANEMNLWGPRGQFRPEPIFSVQFSRYSTSAWYLGDFRRQFARKWKIRFLNDSLGAAGQQAYIDNLVVGQYRIAWDAEVGVKGGYHRVVQNLAASTPPA